MKEQRFFYLVVVTLLVISFLAGPVVPVHAQEWQDLSPDIDSDGLPNEMESSPGWYSDAGGPFVTDPFDADSDDDGLTDGEEKLFGTDPLDNTDPGIYVRYQDDFMTKEYFHTSDPAYLSMKQGGDKYLMSEAMVVRRGTTLHVSGPSTGTLTIDGNGYTNLIPTIVSNYDLYEGGWTVNVPSNGRVGIYTATMSFAGGGQQEMPLYVIFELPTPAEPSTFDPAHTLTQDAIETFLYNDDPSDVRDETGVVWYALNPYKYSRHCDEGYGIPCYDKNNFYHTTRGWSQAFPTEHYQKWIFLDKIMWRIHGQTSQATVTNLLSHGADEEVRVNYTNFGTLDDEPPLSYQISYVLYRQFDGTGETQPGTACHAQAGVFSSFLRSAGIPAQPFITDWDWHQYDTSVRAWFNGQWYAARSYNGEEISGGRNRPYYPFDAGHTYQRPLHQWDSYGQYREDNSEIIVTANEHWDWEMVNTGPINEVGENAATRDYYWRRGWPLELREKSPYMDTYNSLIWKGHSGVPEGWTTNVAPTAYDIEEHPNYPNGPFTENWPIEPIAGECPDEFTGDCPYPNALGGRVWHDADEDGSQNGGELGISGATVSMTLLSSPTDYVYTDTTNGSGDYELAGMPGGTYVIEVASSTLPAGNWTSTTSDTLTITILDEESYTDADFGYHNTTRNAVGAISTSVDTQEELPAPQSQPKVEVSQNRTYLPFVSHGAMAPIQFESIVDDYGIDTDGDGRFDELILEVEVSAAQAGDYTLGGMLAMPEGATAYGGIYADDMRTYLREGVQTVSLVFDGLSIGNAKADGPYQVVRLWVTDLEEFDARLGSWDQVLDAEYFDYVTAHYSADQFEGAAASFAGTYNHRGVDEDGDDLYESIAIDIDLNITDLGSYRVEGDLYDNRDRYVGHATWTGSEPSASLTFDVEKAVPPYNLAHVQLFDARGAMLDSRQQSAYTITDLFDQVDQGPVTMNLYQAPSGDFLPMGETITPHSSL